MTNMVMANVPETQDVLWTAAIDIVQRHTGYSYDEIVPGAEFEGDLGIDSIVLIAILGDLCEACGLESKSTSQSLKTVDDMVGRTEVLSQRETEHKRAKHVDLSRVIANPSEFLTVPDSSPC